jgi:glutamate 5-kinase
VVPVINENDTVVNDEIKFGDNDTLGALVANLVEADVLVILTDQKGLYSADPRKDPGAQFVHEAKAGDPALEPWPVAQGSSIGTRRHDHQDPGRQACCGSGASTVIAWGREPDVPAAPGPQGESIGTLLVAQTAEKAGTQAVDGRSPATARR